jgi:catechol 2,3-dioxygenase-like lactoylglutathione lyase family enzyme
MHVKGLVWLGLRTTQFAEMEKFFRDVMGMQPIREEAGLAEFRLINQTPVELYCHEEEFHTFFTTGPVVAFHVDDVEEARATMEAAGIEFLGPIQRADNASWNHFRASDGTVFEIMSREDEERWGKRSFLKTPKAFRGLGLPRKRSAAKLQRSPDRGILSIMNDNILHRSRREPGRSM